MERHFALPIAFAAAFHGAVLFGFNKSPRAEPPKKDESTFILINPPPPEEEPLPIPETGEASGPKSLPDAPVPVRSPEPIAIEVANAFKISPPPMDTVNMSDIRILPADTLTRGKGDNPWGNGIISSMLLDNTPRTRLQAAPIYPYDAKREGLHGEVLVEFIVDETGAVIEPRVVRSSHRVFEEASLRAVAKWKFEPGRRDGRVVRFRMAVPVVFNLND